MKRLFRNIILMLVLLFIVNGIVHSYFLPFGWGDNVLYVKHEHYKATKEEYNTLFLGGSLVYRHIDPYLIDSLMGDQGIEMNSYNMGVDGNGYLKQRWTFEEIIDNASPDLKYMFVSLSSSAMFLRLNMHTKKFVTWWRFKDLTHAIKVTWDLPITFKRKLKFSYFYLVTLIENRLNFGHLTEAVQFHVKKTGYDESYLGVRKDGFYPYDYQEGRQLMSQAWEDTLLKMSRVAYMTDSIKRDAMRETNIREFRDFDPNSLLMEIMLDTYSDMIETCAEKGIKLVVLMPPRTREPYTYFIPIYNALPDANKINLANPLEYPEFYKKENSYNFHHLDFHGAQLYTTALAHEFLKLEGIEANLYPVKEKVAAPDQE